MKSKLKVVPPVADRPLDMAGDIYAEVRALAHDRERWARMHVAAERRAPLDLQTPPHKRLWSDWRSK